MASSLTRDVALDRYMTQLNRHPLLTREQETALADRYRTGHDLDAAHKLVISNLRFVVKICHEYSGYGFNLFDLIQEGSIGLMHAVSKFDPSKGFRLISYAVWWIRAFVQNFVMRSWSMVKIGTTQAQRKMFFKLRSARERVDRDRASGKNGPGGTEVLAKQFGVCERDVAMMEGRLAGRDFSLDAPAHDGSPQDCSGSFSSTGAPQDEQASATEERQLVRQSVSRAMVAMTARERCIVEERLLAADKPRTLSELGLRFKISRERVRQIEGVVLGKIRKVLVEDMHFRSHSFARPETGVAA